MATLTGQVVAAIGHCGILRGLADQAGCVHNQTLAVEDQIGLGSRLQLGKVLGQVGGVARRGASFRDEISCADANHRRQGDAQFPCNCSQAERSPIIPEGSA